MTTYAHPEDVADFAAGLKQQYLQCRTYGHHFNPHTVERVTDEGHPAAYYEQVLRCRCGARRAMLLSKTGHVVVSRHDYTEAPGYLSQGMGRIVGEGRDALRLESITRLVKTTSAAKTTSASKAKKRKAA